MVNRVKYCASFQKTLSTAAIIQRLTLDVECVSHRWACGYLKERFLRLASGDQKKLHSGL